MANQAIVIGAGIIGLSTCFELQDAGFEVTLIDPDPISGATHHAGGMLAPIAEVQYQQQALIPLMQESALLYPDLIRRVEQFTNLPTGHRTEGTVLIGADRADAGHLGDLLTYLHSQNIAAEPITSREARKLEPALSPRISKAVRIDGDHQLDPRLMARALLDAISHRGAEIIKDRVIAIDGGDPYHSVRCTEQVVEASTSVIVLAAGLGAGAITGAMPPMQLRPVYGDILRVRVPETISPLITRVVRGFVEDRPVYLIPRNDGTLTIGATSREDQPLPRSGAIHDLLRDAIRLVPSIEETQLLEATCGARPGTPDDLPYLGKAGSNLIISTGYFRHGILLAALAAHSAVCLAQDKPLPLDLHVCDPFRHAPNEGKR